MPEKYHIDWNVLAIEVLSAHHARKSFDCGNSLLNDFLQRTARQNADRNIGVTHVVVPRTGDIHILGYYTLVVRTVDESIIPPPPKLPRGPIGVTLLGRLAVDKSAQGQKLGTFMVLQAIRQTERAARELGIHGLVLDAIDDYARDWYLGLDFGFKPLLDDTRHLLLPIATIRQLGLGENDSNST